MTGNIRSWNAIFGPFAFASCVTSAASAPPALIAADRDLVRIDAKFGRMRLDPLHRRKRIVERGGEFVFGREAIIDRDHAQTTLVRELAAQTVMGIEIADHEPAAVEIDQHR